jgi:hypothetical protein
MCRVATALAGGIASRGCCVVEVVVDGAQYVVGASVVVAPPSCAVADEAPTTRVTAGMVASLRKSWNMLILASPAKTVGHQCSVARGCQDPSTYEASYSVELKC